MSELEGIVMRSEGRKSSELELRTISIMLVLTLVSFSLVGLVSLMGENVRAQDPYEPDDTPAQASPIPTDGTLQTHTFHVAGDVDWVIFPALSANYYVIETHNLILADTYIYLVDTDGTTVLDEDDDGGLGLASKIVFFPPRDDLFYVEITEFGGDGGPGYSYDINVTESMIPLGGDVYEPDNNPAQASFIDTDGTIQSHNFHFAGDPDWVQFIALSGNLHTIETHNLVDADTYIYLIDTDGVTVLDEDDDGGVGLASKIVWLATVSDIFYVKVVEFNDRSGLAYTYDINITTSTPPGGDAYEPDNDPAEANPIPTDGTIQSHNFHVPSDPDWVWFTITPGDTYFIRTSNLGAPCDTVLFLFETDGVTLIDFDDDSGGGSASLIVWNSVGYPPGDYYVLVLEAAGGFGAGYTYDLNVTRSGPGNILPEARDILVDGYPEGSAEIMHILSANPLFEWSYFDPEGQPQTDYQVRVGTASGLGDMWDPGPAGGP
ncbi:MAG: hypothetical protein ACE5QW_07805, partial [Thermoplasmata archaeon]